MQRAGSPADSTAARREVLLGVSATAAALFGSQLLQAGPAAADEAPFTSVIGDDEPSTAAPEAAAPAAAQQESTSSGGSVSQVSTLVSFWLQLHVHAFADLCCLQTAFRDLR